MSERNAARKFSNIHRRAIFWIVDRLLGFIAGGDHTWTFSMRLNEVRSELREFSRMYYGGRP